MDRRHIWAGTGGLVALALSVAACGSASRAAAPATTTTAPTAATSTTAPPAATTTTPTVPPTSVTSTTVPPTSVTSTTVPPTTSVTTSVAPAQAAACTGPQLTVGLGSGGGGGLSHAEVVFTFRNISSQTCSLSGYPGVDGLLPTGQRVAAKRTLNGYLGGVTGATPPILELAPGDTASAIAEDTDAAIPPATSCASFDAFLVTAPNTTTTQRVVADLPACIALQVHPVVAGTTGAESP